MIKTQSWLLWRARFTQPKHNLRQQCPIRRVASLSTTLEAYALDPKNRQLVQKQLERKLRDEQDRLRDQMKDRAKRVKPEARNQSLQPFKSTTLRKRYQDITGHFFRWIRGLPRQHFGPESKLVDLFARRDFVYEQLASYDLVWRPKNPPSQSFEKKYIDERVRKVEGILGYTFKNRWLCMEALNKYHSNVPVSYDGIIIPLAKNKRLALLGDRVLLLVITSEWHRADTRRQIYGEMVENLLSRNALFKRAMKFGLDQSRILRTVFEQEISEDSMAETFEAIVGAVYVDTGESVPETRKVLGNLGFYNNRTGYSTIESVIVTAVEYQRREKTHEREKTAYENLGNKIKVEERKGKNILEVKKEKEKNDLEVKEQKDKTHLKVKEQKEKKTISGVTEDLGGLEPEWVKIYSRIPPEWRRLMASNPPSAVELAEMKWPIQMIRFLGPPEKD